MHKFLIAMIVMSLSLGALACGGKGHNEEGDKKETSQVR